MQNQLVKVDTHTPQETVTYTYDPLGRRIEKHDAFGTTRYRWTDNQLAQKTRKGIKKTYLYEPASFRPVALVQDDQVYHYHLDHLGTPRELTDERGKIVWRVKYKTYGNVAIKEVDEIENNLRFQGQYFDEETGLHYNRHRYYNPDTGQFINQDPIGLLGGVNNYQYAPNPNMWVDPFGLSCKEKIARIHHYEADESNPYGHYSVEIFDENSSIHTHQVITAQDQTTIVDFEKFPASKPLVKTIDIKIPNTQGALSYQKKQLFKDLGPYDPKTNSCIDHVSNVLRAGGLEIKKSAIGQLRYLKNLGF